MSRRVLVFLPFAAVLASCGRGDEEAPQPVAAAGTTAAKASASVSVKPLDLRIALRRSGSTLSSNYLAARDPKVQRITLTNQTGSSVRLRGSSKFGGGSIDVPARTTRTLKWPRGQGPHTVKGRFDIEGNDSAGGSFSVPVR